MSSIMTNASALTALQSLNSTNKNLEMTQARISTGYRVATASDNAAYWSIATTMRSDNKALSVVQDTLGLGAGKVDTAYTAMTKAIETSRRDQGQARRRQRRQRRPTRRRSQTEINALQAQLKIVADGANFAGSNLLQTRRPPPPSDLTTQDRLVLQPHRRRHRHASTRSTSRLPTSQASRRGRHQDGIVDGGVHRCSAHDRSFDPTPHVSRLT